MNARINGEVNFRYTATFLFDENAFYDFCINNKVSLEDLELDKAKIELVNPDGIVWVVEDAGSSHKYHLSDDCYHIKNRETEAITIEEAYERSITDMCNDCYKKTLKQKGYTSDQIDKILINICPCVNQNNSINHKVTGP